MPSGDGSDDEETIAVEEAEVEVDDASTQQELEALQRDMELPIDELLRSLPPEVLQKPADIIAGSDASGSSDEDSNAGSTSSPSTTAMTSPRVGQVRHRSVCLKPVCMTNLALFIPGVTVTG